MVLTLFNGSYNTAEGGNERGLSWGWYHPESEISYNPPNANYTQALSLLTGRLQSEYDKGWRRFMLYLPAGGVQGHVFSGNQWTALLPWMQHLFQNEFHAWVNAHPEATVGVYSGWVYRASDPSSLCTTQGGVPGCHPSPCTNECPAAYTVTNPDGLADLINNTIPWQSVGVKEIFFDLAGAAPDELVLASHHPAFSGLRFGGEAVPLAPILSTPQCDWVVHPCYKDKIAWTGLVDGFWNNANIMGSAFLPAHTFDAATTEIGLWMGSGPLVPGGSDNVDPSALSLNTMKCLLSHGYVPWTPPSYGGAVGEHRIELLKRIYGFGHIDIRDFNGDGNIDGDDLGDFITTYFEYSAIVGFHGNMIHGDVNGDGNVDADDLGDFITTFYSSTNPNVDFGGPNPERVFPIDAACE